MNFKTAKMMTKYRVCMTFMSILLLLFHFVFLFSCGKLPEKTFAFSDNLRIDSLEHMAMDSIYRNPRYAHSALDEALSLTKDSDKYYKLLAAKSQIYFANNYRLLRPCTDVSQDTWTLRDAEKYGWQLLFIFG